MWEGRVYSGNDKPVFALFTHHGDSLTYANVLQYWQTDARFRSYFNAFLAGGPYKAFRWETPPITAATVNRRFEFVLHDSPELITSPDAKAFAEHFVEDGGVVEFANLRKDAILIVPCPGEPLSAYAHLGAFARYAPEAQQHALWQRVGEAMQRRLGDKPVWLSIAGAGVAWLHVRLDDRPKYYGYAPYRDAK